MYFVIGYWTRKRIKGMITSYSKSTFCIKILSKHSRIYFSWLYVTTKTLSFIHWVIERYPQIHSFVLYFLSINNNIIVLSGRGGNNKIRYNQAKWGNFRKISSFYPIFLLFLKKVSCYSIIAIIFNSIFALYNILWFHVSWVLHFFYPFPTALFYHARESI